MMQNVVRVMVVTVLHRCKHNIIINKGIVFSGNSDACFASFCPFLQALMHFPPLPLLFGFVSFDFGIVSPNFER